MTSNDAVRSILSVVLAVAIFTAMNYDTSQVWLVILAGYLLVAVVSYVRQALAVRRMVRALRRLDPAFRRRVVNSINSEVVRDYYDARLRQEGDADVTGVVERYPFAPSDRSEQTRWYWTVVVVAGLALASPILWPHMAGWQRTIALATVLISLGILAMNRRRMRLLDTVLEVSPYGLAEVHPDGTRRVLAFNQPLACRVNRWRSRVEIGLVRGRRRDRIFVDFDRVGFNRLFMSVLLLGGFVRPAPRSASAEQSSASPEQPKQSIPIPIPWRLPTFSQWQGRRIAAAFWPALLVLAVVPVVQRLADQLGPRFEPMAVQTPLPTDPLALDSVIVRTMAFRYPGEFIVRAPGDTIWIQGVGRADSAGIYEVRSGHHKERLWVVPETHHLTRRVILQP